MAKLTASWRSRAREWRLRYAQILFDGHQTYAPDRTRLPANKAIVQVYAQASKVYERIFDWVSVEIWRSVQPITITIGGATSTGALTLNVPIVSTPDGPDQDVCNGALENIPGSTPVDTHSLDASVTQAFDVIIGGRTIQTGCTFAGNYDSNFGGGVRDGVLSCNGGFTLRCDGESIGPPSSTCGKNPRASCSLSAGDCYPYYELLAFCQF